MGYLFYPLYGTYICYISILAYIRASHVSLFFLSGSAVVVHCLYHPSSHHRASGGLYARAQGHAASLPCCLRQRCRMDGLVSVPVSSFCAKLRKVCKGSYLAPSVDDPEQHSPADPAVLCGMQWRAVPECALLCRQHASDCPALVLL